MLLMGTKPDCSKRTDWEKDSWTHFISEFSEISSEDNFVYNSWGERPFSSSRYVSTSSGIGGKSVHLWLRISTSLFSSKYSSQLPSFASKINECAGLIQKRYYKLDINTHMSYCTYCSRLSFIARSRIFCSTIVPVDNIHIFSTSILSYFAATLALSALVNGGNADAVADDNVGADVVAAQTLVELRALECDVIRGWGTADSNLLLSWKL